ncbi:MAG: exopolyphosphatase / guanosine-5-triphosphate,3-diphosphate pyrophosphatase [Frankiaceae bacterium]|jgi:exopolyphosphatase/guanosine-5'-triphosphate,3'-diphosphate pyrophosphatase|nr:exopolyphosphatase / guanosine-5-triphosphate,3-diphosphate pyrophosphatase [Frankiaceae bacterium]
MRGAAVSRRVAAIDCGTNSIRLLVADVTGDRLVDVVRRMEIVRLGAGVDRTGRLSDGALARTFAALDDYAEQIQSLDVGRVRMVATSASRDASNRDVFVSGVEQRLGIAPDVVTGAEEAALSFEGATRELRGSTALPAPYLVCDIGGGSTEFVVGDDAAVRAARSVDVGCVRLTERHLRDDPPTVAQVQAARDDVEAALDLVVSTVPVADAATLVGLAGSVTTVVAIALDLPGYDAGRIHHARIGAEQVHDVTERLLAMRRSNRAALAVMHPGRVDVIAAGALVLDTVVRRYGFDEVVASEHDILDGIAYSIGGAPAPP